MGSREQVSCMVRSVAGKPLDRDAAARVADAMLASLMNLGQPGYANPSVNEITEMLEHSYSLMSTQPMCLELLPPLVMVGDIHGQFNDLIRIFGVAGFPPKTNYLFLGDYVDRGQHSLETIFLLLAMKLKYPDNFFLLRGNHETSLVNRIYGFYEDIQQRYKSVQLYDHFQEVFSVMPLSAVVGGRILAMHGGLSADMASTASLVGLLNSIVRPLRDPPNPSLHLDLLWADPHIGVVGFKASIRGVSCTFGPDVLTEVCTRHGIDLVVRAHQVVQDGYEFFGSRKLVTLFSAPHYCGQFDNAAALLCVDERLNCSFKVLRPKFPLGSGCGGAMKRG